MKKLFLSLILIALIFGCENEQKRTKKIIQEQPEKEINVEVPQKVKDTIVLLEGGIQDPNEIELIRLFNISQNDPEAEQFKVNNPSLNPEFTIQKKQFFSRGSENYILAVLNVAIKNASHFESGFSYIGCFQFKNGGWKLVDRPVKSNLTAMWGNCPDVKRFDKYGENAICVGLEGASGNNGIMETYIQFYGFDGDDKINLIYEGVTFSGDGGAGGDVNDEYLYKFKATNNLKYYPLEQKKKSNERIVKTRIFNFNENKKKYE